MSFIPRSSFFSVIHVNVDIKIKSKKRIGFVVVVLITKILGGYSNYRENAWVIEMQKFHPGLHEGVDVRTDVRRIFSDQILGRMDNQIFLPMVLRCTRLARERAPLKIIHREAS